LSYDWGCFPKCCGSLQAKVAIRELLPNGLRESISKVRSSVAYAVSAIAHWDWPEAWPELFNLLMEMLVSGDVNVVHGAMRVLTGTCTQQGCPRRCCRLFFIQAFCPFVLQIELELAAAALQGRMPSGCAGSCGSTVSGSVLRAAAPQELCNSLLSDICRFQHDICLQSLRDCHG